MHVMSESYKSRTLGNVIGEFMQAHGNACISLGRWVLFCLHMRRVLSHKAGSFTFNKAQCVMRCDSLPNLHLYLEITCNIPTFARNIHNV